MKNSLLPLFASVFLFGCQTTINTPEALSDTWYLGRIVVPHSISSTGNSCSGIIGKKFNECTSLLDPSRNYPVVIYMHGCTGLYQDNMLPFRRQLITIAPNSFARPGRTAICSGNKQGVMRLRFAEVDYAIRMLLKQNWVDPGKIILAGFSEGGATAALYPGDQVAARIILGWVCHSSVAWWRGIRGPKDTPVLAVVGSKDEYYRSGAQIGTHCGTVFYDRPNSRSLVLENRPHNIVTDYHTMAAIKAFLNDIGAFANALGSGWTYPVPVDTHPINVDLPRSGYWRILGSGLTFHKMSGSAMPIVRPDPAFCGPPAGW